MTAVLIPNEEFVRSASSRPSGGEAVFRADHCTIPAVHRTLDDSRCIVVDRAAIGFPEITSVPVSRAHASVIRHVELKL